MKKIILFLTAGALFFAGTVNASTLFPTGGGTGSTTLSGILIGNGTAPVNTLTIGTGLTLTGSTLTATGGGGGSSFGQTFNFVAGTPNYLIGTTSPLGLIMTASTTIGNGTRNGGLTISGGATTTQGLYITGPTLSLTTTGIANVRISNNATNDPIIALDSGSSVMSLDNNVNNLRFILNGSGVIAQLSSTGQLTASSFVPTSATVPTLGAFSAGTNIYSISTAGVERFRISAAGLVGINVVPTAANFEIQATTSNASSNAFTIWNSGSANIFNVSGSGSTTASNGFNITAGCYAINSTCLTTGSGSSFGQAWEMFGSPTYLAPTSTLGIIVNASSTIGNGTQANGLTVAGGATTTGNAYFASGSAAAPSIAFSANPTTGFSNSAGTISISSAGTARLLIGSGLNFNSSSVTNGSIIQSGNAGGYQLFSGTGASVTAPILIPDRGDTTTGFAAGVAGNINAIIGGVEKVRWTSVGEGIGSSTPFFNLSVGSNNVGNFGISTTTAGAACFSSIGELYSGACGGTTYTGSAPITVTGSIIGTSFSTSTFNSYTNQNVFTSIFATLASSTNSTTTNLAIVGNASNCGGTSALTTNSSGVVGCTAQPQGTVTSVTATYPILSSGGATPVISTAFGTTTNWGLGSNGLVIVGSSGIPSVVASSSLNLPNTALQNSSITVNGSSISLGGSATVTANTTNALTFNNSGSGAASGTTFNGGSAQTISYNTIGAQVAGTYVTAVSVATANGFSGSSSGGTTPALTIIASGCNGICKSNATTLSTASAGTDYLAPTGSGSGLTGIPTSVSNVDGTLTISPTTGSVVASIALAHINTWTGTQTFNAGSNSAIFGNNVGIGTTTPYSNYQVEVASSTGQQLVFSDASKTSDQWAFRNSGGVLNIGTSSPLTGATSTTQSAVQISSNTATLLGVATTTPWRTLSVTGTVGFDGLTAAFGTVQGICYETATKEIVVNSLASCVTSSKRWKTDIDYSDTPDLQTFMQLKPVTFTRIDSHLKQIGFIAEDIAALDPRLAGYDEQGLASSIDDTGILAITVKAVQQQQAEIISMDKGIKNNAEDNWQWVAIALLVIWNVYLTLRKK